jgi:hypothetical protein
MSLSTSSFKGTGEQRSLGALEAVAAFYIA